MDEMIEERQGEKKYKRERKGHREKKTKISDISTSHAPSLLRVKKP